MTAAAMPDHLASYYYPPRLLQKFTPPRQGINHRFGRFARIRLLLGWRASFLQVRRRQMGLTVGLIAAFLLISGLIWYVTMIEKSKNG